MNARPFWSISIFLFIVPYIFMDYELMDFGDNKRLERFGSYKLIRPDTRAMGGCLLPESLWQTADAEFVVLDSDSVGEWRLKDPSVPKSWTIDCSDLRVRIKLGLSKQVGLFPEQYEEWNSLISYVKGVPRPLRVLNLFGYTGIASLLFANVGAHVTHVDSLKSALIWGRENQELSGLSDKPIRWLHDDAQAFVARELRRGSKYDAIILDPPVFGRGPKGQVWNFERDLGVLLRNCSLLLNTMPLFVVLNVYSAELEEDYTRHLFQEVFSSSGFAKFHDTRLMLRVGDGRLLDSGTTSYFFEVGI